MAKMSRDGVPGIPKGLKEKDIKCAVCTHANITKNNAPGVATGASDADCHFDMVDMSRIKTISGMQYCTVFIMTKTRYAYCYLHKTKDEITAIMDRFLEQNIATNTNNFRMEKQRNSLILSAGASELCF